MLIPDELLLPAAPGTEHTVHARAPGLVSLCPEIRPEAILQGKVFYDPSRKHHFAKVDFNAVVPLIPAHLETKVNEDNASFQVEKYMFSPGFFESSFDMVGLMLKQCPEVLQQASPNSEGVFSFIEKLVFEILPWGKKTKEVQDMTQVLIRMLKLNTEQTFGFIKRRILKTNDKGEVDTALFKILLSGSLEIREAMSQIMVHCISTCTAETHL